MKYPTIRLPPKTEVIKINISESFMTRARCKECGKGPDYYYATMKPFMWKEVKYFMIFSEFSKKWFSKNSGWFKDFEPRYFTKAGDFSRRLEDKSYNPIVHRTKGADINDRYNVVEYIGCGCGATIWAFNNVSVQKRPEITSRKGRYKYPQKFSY